MLALALYREGLCPTCTGVLADTTAPENEGKYRAELPLKCFRCEAFGLSHDAYADQPQPMSLLHLVPRKPR
jgi:hypothetical protein